MDDYSRAFKDLLSSPLGEQLISELNARKSQLLDEAATAKTQENAFALLKQASGVILAIEHLQFLAVVPTDEGSK